MIETAFWWDVLDMAALEDWQMLYGPLGWARTRLREVGEVDRQRLAESTLRDLFARDLIFFFRVLPNESVLAVGGGPSRRLSSVEVDRVVSGDHWRTVPLGVDGANVLFAATEEGLRIAKSAPPEILDFWQIRGW